MKVFGRILIPIDLSERSSHAVEAAARLADSASTLTLLHVIAEIEGVPSEDLDEFYAGLRARACGAEVLGAPDGAFEFGTQQLLCWQCAERRGGRYDARQERWSVAPELADLRRRLGPEY